MRPIPFLVAACLGLLTGCCWTHTGSRSTPNVLLDTDRAFAAASRAHGYATAFEKFLAPAAVSLPEEEDILKGRDNIVASLRKGADALILWEPEFADMSRSGELGYTYGHYTVELKDGKKFRGKYVTIWKRQRDGAWKAVLDGGSLIHE